MPAYNNGVPSQIFQTSINKYLEFKKEIGNFTDFFEKVQNLHNA